MSSTIRNYAKFRAECMKKFITKLGVRGEEIPEGETRTGCSETEREAFVVQELVSNGDNTRWMALPSGRSHFDTKEEAVERLAAARREYKPGTRTGFLEYARLGLRVVRIAERIVTETTVDCVAYEKGGAE